MNRERKSFVSYFLKSLIIFLFVVCAHDAKATNLRGQLIRWNPQVGRYFPLVNVQVNLWVHDGFQWLNLGYTFSDSNGFYYFNEVSPNYTFQIQVFNSFKLNPALVVLQVYPPYYQDIPQIAT